MAVPASVVWKLEDDSTFAVNCFPARGIARSTHEGAGSWIIAYAHEQHRRFGRSLKPIKRVVDQYSEEIKFSSTNKDVEQHRGNSLNEDFLLRHHHIDTAIDLCSVNVCDCDLEFTDDVNFSKFENVAYVNASENLLSLAPFHTFPALREIELPVNGIRGIKVKEGDFPSLQVLDLSYNNLSSSDVLALGILPRLKVLTLTGNGLSEIHPGICQSYVNSKGESCIYFQNLEVLLLDDNRLRDMATFAALASLPALRELNLDKNGIMLVPYLKVLGEKVLSETHSFTKDRPSRSANGKKSSRGSSRKNKRVLSGKGTVSGIIEPLTQLPFENNEKDDEKREDDVDNGRQAESRENVSGGLSEQSHDVSMPTPPFQQLRILSLANNKIADEEHVLAVAGWPSLQVIVLHGNPLIIRNNGEPPMLSHYLRKRCGISIMRQKSKTPVIKPHLQMPVHEHRKVTSTVPKILKQPVDLMIENMRNPAILHTPHPPTVPKETQTFQIEEITSRKTEIKVPQENLESDQENVFLTQVNEDCSEDVPQQPLLEKKPSAFTEKKAKSKKDVGNNLLQEILKDAKPDPDVHEALSIQGNIKLLRQILHHPVTCMRINEPPENRVKKFIYRPDKTATGVSKRDVRSLARPNVHQERARRLQNSLKAMRDRPAAAIELPLLDALTDERYKDEHREAHDLLEEIEKKYRVVREESLRASRQAGRALKETKAHIENLQENLKT